MLRLMRPEILFPLFADVSTLKGVGPRSAPLVHKLAGPLVRDVLFLSPSGIIQRRHTTAAAAIEGEIGIFDVLIDRLIPPHKIGAPLKMRASDDTGFVHLIWFAGSPRHIESLAPRGERRLVTGKVERFNNEVQIAHPDYILPLEKADEIPLSEPVYPATQGLTSRVVRKLAQGALATAPDLAEWQDAAWPWDVYGPVAMAAVRAGVPVLGGNLPRCAMAAAMQETRWDDHLAATARQQLHDALQDGHCGLLPAARLPAMARIQIARDASLARTAQEAVRPGQTVLLVAGGEHVLRHRGIPTHWPASLTSKVASALTDQAQAATKTGVDTVITTAPLPPHDACAALRPPK